MQTRLTGLNLDMVFLYMTEQVQLTVVELNHLF